MAITKIHRIHKTLDNAIAYVVNGAKTEDKTLLSSFACSQDPSIASWQFEQKKNAMHDSRINTLAHHLIQSFLPGEVDANTAHKIGVELADKYLGGRYQYVIATHVDKGHIHNHIIFNAISINQKQIYKSYKKSYYDIRNLSDELCKEHGLYVIPPSPNRGQSFYEYTQAKQGTSYKAKLKETIDNLIPFCKDYEDLIKRLEHAGYEIKRGKYISVITSNQERFTRIKTLGIDYTEEVLIDRIRSKSKHIQIKKPDRNAGKIIDIKGSKNIRDNPGLTRWATIHNLQVTSAEYNAMKKLGFSSLESLQKGLDKAIDVMEEKQHIITKIDDKRRHLSIVMEYVNNYKGTISTYKEFQKAKDKDSFLQNHESEVTMFEAMSKQIKEMGYPKLPSFKSLKSEYDDLGAERSLLHSEYKESKAKVDELTSLKNNLEKFLGKDIQKARGKKRDELE